MARVKWWGSARDWKRQRYQSRPLPTLTRSKVYWLTVLSDRLISCQKGRGKARDRVVVLFTHLTASRRWSNATSTFPLRYSISPASIASPTLNSEGASSDTIKSGRIHHTKGLYVRGWRETSELLSRHHHTVLHPRKRFKLWARWHVSHTL